MPKKILPSYRLINAGSMTGTTVITSAATNIQFLDNVCLQLVWTGTPNGTFDLQGSVDHTQDQNGNVTNAGTWTSVSLSPSPAATGAAGNILLDLNQLSFPYVRIVYTNTSSTGTLNAYIGGKEV